MAEQPTSLELVKLLESAATALVHMPPEDDEVADVISIMDRCERLLKTTRRSWERKIVTEMEPIPQAKRVRQPKRKSTRDVAPVAQSQDFELQPITETERTYNFPATVTNIQRVTGWDTLRTLLELNRADALRFQFQWTNLKTFLKQVRVPMTLAFEPVDDDDGIEGYMVGEYEKNTGRFKKVPIEDKDRVQPMEVVPDPEPEPEGDDAVPFHPMAPGDEVGE
ncbi:MAG: hypothetical protein GY906_10350 [bacterium]|nr:hypothetical protein [bacterium]